MNNQHDNNATACSSLFNSKANATTSRFKIEAYGAIRPLTEVILSEHGYQKYDNRNESDQFESPGNSPLLPQLSSTQREGPI